MVSPVYKGGYAVDEITAVAPDGESLAFAAHGGFGGIGANFVGNGYLASRAASGWSSAPLTPPATLAPESHVQDPLDFSASLGTSLAIATKGSNKGVATVEGTENEFLLHQTSAAYAQSSFEVAGEPLLAVGGVHWEAAYVGASTDFSHILFLQVRSPTPLLAKTETVGPRALYDLTSHSSTKPLSLVGVDNKGNVLGPSCPVFLGNDEQGGGNDNRPHSTTASSLKDAGSLKAKPRPRRLRLDRSGMRAPRRSIRSDRAPVPRRSA